MTHEPRPPGGTMDDDWAYYQRPSGGDRFEAVFMIPDGWTVLAAWRQTMSPGHWYRPHVAYCGHGPGSREQAMHTAAELNAAAKENDNG